MFNTVIEVMNSLTNNLTLWFEPWAESIEIHPKDSVFVEIVTHTEHALLIQQSPEGMVFFGMPKDTSRVRNGEGLTILSAWEPAPDEPH